MQLYLPWYEFSLIFSIGFGLWPVVVLWTRAPEARNAL